MSRNSALVSLVLALACVFPVARGEAAALSPPSASTAGASNVSYSSAILAGSVDPRGQETAYVFQWGPTRGYGSETPLSPAGSGTKLTRVSDSVSGLQPLTTYYY